MNLLNKIKNYMEGIINVPTEMVTEEVIIEVTPEVVTDVSDYVKFNVLDKSGAYVQSYDSILHGEDAESNANNYANKIGGTVVKN